jgi:hypothetical protein
MHLQGDPPPHVLEDELGLKLVAPDEGWRRRLDMDPETTKYFRASTVARAHACRPILLRQAGWFVSTQKYRRTAGRNDLIEPRRGASRGLKRI